MANKLNHAIVAGMLLFVWGFLTCGLLTAAAPKLAQFGKTRTWTVAGKPQVAKLIAADDGSLTLESEDGTSKRHMLGFASQADQAFVRSFLAQRLKQVPAKFRESRKWTDKQGKVLGEGPISSASDRDIYIQMNGEAKSLFYPFLSDGDKQFIAEFLKASPSNPSDHGAKPKESDTNLGPREFRAMKEPMKEKFGQVRTWTDVSGEFQTRASLHSASEIEVRLVLENGRGLTLKRGQLAETDRQFLDEYLAVWVETPDVSPEEAEPEMPNNPFEQLPTSIRLADALIPEWELGQYGQRRVWKDQSGFHFVEANMLAANRQSVQLKLEELRYINIPVDQLDAADRKLVEEFVMQAEQKAAEKAEKQTQEMAAKNAFAEQMAAARTAANPENSIEFEEISFVKRTADFSKAKRLSYTINQTWKARELSPIPLQQQSLEDAVIQIGGCEGVFLATQAPVAVAYQRKWGKSTCLAIGRPGSTDQSVFKLNDDWRLKHVSPDGTAAVLMFHQETENRVAIVDIEGTRVAPRFEFAVSNSNQQRIVKAFLTSHDRLVSVLNNTVTVWDLTPETGPVALAQYDPIGMDLKRDGVTIAPSGEAFAVPTSKGVMLVDSQTCDVIGTIEGPRWDATGFSSDGRQLAVGQANNVQIYDLKTGSKVSDFAVMDPFLKHFNWPDRDYLLVDEVLYSLKEHLPICRYEIHTTLNIGYGRFYPVLNHHVGSHTSRIRFIKLPDATAIQRESTLKKSDAYALYRGGKVRLDVQVQDVSSPDRLRADITRELEKTCKAHGWIIAPDAKTVIVARVEGEKYEREFTVEKSTLGTVVDAVGGIFGGSSTPEEEKVKVKCIGWLHLLQVKHGQTEVLAHRHSEQAPPRFDVRISETMEQAANRVAKPDPNWFSKVRLDNPVFTPFKALNLPHVRVSAL